MKSKLSILCIVTLLVFSFGTTALEACTLWGAAGNAVAGGGTLIVKNRDWKPNHSQSLKLFKPRNGYHYFGLITVGNRISSGVRAGINEKGLVIVNATASSISAGERLKMPGTPALIENLLSQCGSVDAALSKSELFLGPRFLLLADSKKIAIVEIGPDGRTAVKAEENGVLYHTNHYVEESLLDVNESIGASSKVRYRRIESLLKKSPKPFTMDDFIAFSKDQNAGPNNSIFRTGSSPTISRTLAVWAVAIPPAQSPELYIRILNPGEKEQLYRLTANDVFAGKWSAIKQ